MKRYNLGEFEVVVIGAGYAGCEAALASARLGKKTAVITLSLDQIANMPCNPSIGGTAKGHIVCEIDALGGEMGRAADKTMLQSRMLNRGKGPAVHSLRVQSDRAAYHLYMKKVLEDTKNLRIIQGEVVEIMTEGNVVTGVVTALGQVIKAKCVVLAGGTYLRSRIFIGEYSKASGADNSQPANDLSPMLEGLGIKFRRFKTGTPARVAMRSINLDILEPQQGDEEIIPFSFDTDYPLKNKIDCYISYTNEQTHEVINENMHRSPLFSGEIEGTGPRYCPSIEDKVMRFADKPRHQLFLEPMGENDSEVYLQGMSSSLPAEVQEDIYHSIKGLEDAEIMRYAYAIEYDCIDPTTLKPSLEMKEIEGLFSAGQVNGSSGYEEAAAQGLMAGINCVMKLDGKQPLIIDRSEGYIGVLIDDLVTKGTEEPYRMMTSRSEFRLLLRQDNAVTRLLPKGYEIGLVSEERYQKFKEQEEMRESEKKRLSELSIKPSEELNKLLSERGSSPITQSMKFADLLLRPQISLKELYAFDANAPKLPLKVHAQLETEIKYAGYIKKQQAQVESLEGYRNTSLVGVNYKDIVGLRLEAVEKLEKISPLTLSQAMGISGVSPADIAVILIWLKANKGKKHNDK